jgi:hypothetical protein
MVKEFVTFGCWNKGLCDKTEEQPKNGLSAMMKELGKYVEENKIEFLAISGDNYYPEKEKDATGKKTKTWNQSEFESGFQCLPPNITTYLLMGNHDLESIKMIDSESKDKLSECHTVQEEVKQKDVKIRNFYTLFGESTIAIFIDTSIYKGMSEEDLQCYKWFIRKNFVNIHEAQNHQLQKVKTLLKKNVKPSKSKIRNIVILGHHPIFGAKMKKGEEINEKLDDTGVEFFLNIRTFLGGSSKYKFYYLCADIHNYQHIKIILGNKETEMSIEQHIVGTGGADLDKVVDLGKGSPGSNLGRELILSPGIIKSATLFDCKSQYGFLVCKDVPEKLEFTFQPADFEYKNTMEGGSRRTKKKGRRQRKTVKKYHYNI